MLSSSEAARIANRGVYEDKKSWRELDRGRDKKEYRDERPKGKGPKLETATAQYKQKLDAFFDRGVVPEHLKGKLPTGDGEGPSERQQLLRKIRDAKESRGLMKALDKLIEKYDLPEDPEIWLRALEHTSDKVLMEVLVQLEAYLDSGEYEENRCLHSETPRARIRFFRSQGSEQSDTSGSEAKMRLSTSVERDLRVEGRTLFWSLFCLLLVACGANNHVVNPVNLSAEVETKLVELRNRFFATASVTEMVNLSQEAKSIAPDAFVSHELAGELALLQARGGDANRHFLGALAMTQQMPTTYLLALDR